MDFKRKYDSDGNEMVVPQPVNGSEANFYAPNLCDPCSWYVESLVLTNFGMTDKGDHTTWSTGGLHINWIDAKHGRLFNEDNLLLADPSLTVKVEVQAGGSGAWVEKVENTW